jgi:hypothetical protein
MGSNGRKRTATLKPVRKKRIGKKVVRSIRSRIKKARVEASVPEASEAVEALDAVEAQPSPEVTADVVVVEAEPPGAEDAEQDSEAQSAEDSFARLTSEVGVTSESVAAVLASMTKHMADDKLFVRTHAAQTAPADGFSEWSQMQQELQGRAGVESPSLDRTSRLLVRVVSRAEQWSRERPASWTGIVFAAGLLIGGILAKLL